MSVSTIGKAIRLIVGNCTNGSTPMTLLKRISVKSVRSRGTNGRKSLAPMTSRAMELRTKP